MGGEGIIVIGYGATGQEYKSGFVEVIQFENIGLRNNHKFGGQNEN